MKRANGGTIMGITVLRMTLLAAVFGLIAGCGQVTPVAYTPIDEIPPGPGLLSGEDGEFTVYRR